jgi:hypothetical protein
MPFMLKSYTLPALVAGSLLSLTVSAATVSQSQALRQVTTSRDMKQSHIEIGLLGGYNSMTTGLLGNQDSRAGRVFSNTGECQMSTSIAD